MVGVTITRQFRRYGIGKDDLTSIITVAILKKKP
jgi:hypothetical protein